MKKTAIIILSFLIQLTANTYAQKLKPAFKKYHKGQYQEAYSAFNKMRNKPCETVAAHYGIGLIYNNPAYQKHNSVTAYMNLTKAKSKYASLSQNEKSLLSQNYSIDLYAISAQIDSSAAGEYTKALQTHTEEGYYSFIRKYRESQKYSDMARQQIEILKQEQRQQIAKIFHSMKADVRYPQTAISKLNQFLYQYGRHKAFPRQLIDSVSRQLMHEAFISGEPLDIEYIYSNLSPALIPKLTATERLQLQTAQNVYSEVPFMEPYSDSQLTAYQNYIRQAAPCDLAYVAVLRIMTPYISGGRYSEAAEVLSQYRPLFPNKAADIDKTINLLIGKAPEFSNLKRLPDAVNKGYVGYPVLSANGKILYFAKYPIPFNHTPAENHRFEEDIYLCDYLNGKCENVRPLSQINTPGAYERPSAVHPSGNELLYYTKSQIYTASLYGNTKPRPFQAINKTADAEWVSDACYTPDGNAVLFSAISDSSMGFRHPRTRQITHGGNLGNPDIYICLRENGQWGNPINLGPVINTKYGEFCPVLASDMKTLYFSSNGHYGLGGTDLFVSRRLSDSSWTLWSEPVNLGRNINTSFDDNNLCIGSDGKTAFYVKNDNIYSFQMPDEIKAAPVSIVEGVVKNKDNEPLPAHISWEDLSNGRLIGQLDNNPVSGEFFITLPQGKNYGYVIESDGYFPVSGHINTSEAETITVNKDITLISETDLIESGQSVIMENIFFDFGQYQLKKESHSEINRLLRFLNIDHRIKIEISGHTDNVGTHDSNVTLSLNRAQAVKNYLISKGIAGSRISVKGYGPDKPVSSNSTAEGRMKNRRVEFKVLNVY